MMETLAGRSRLVRPRREPEVDEGVEREGEVVLLFGRGYRLEDQQYLRVEPTTRYRGIVAGLLRVLDELADATDIVRRKRQSDRSASGIVFE
jgi:hypothetical protein